MLARPAIPAPRARQAFTLLEVLLTLCLLVVLASMTWPVLSRPMANQRLRKAADRVQMEWVRARVKAMSNGCVYLFCYSAESDRYCLQSQLAPESVSEDGLTAGGLTAGGLTTGGQSAVGAAGTAGGAGWGAGGAGWTAGGETQDCRLPEGIRFVLGETAPDSRSQTTFAQPIAMPAQPTAAADETTAWAAPIYFYPDGITSTATVRLANEYGSTIDVSLRGLTGIATVGQVQTGGGTTP